MDNDTYEVAGDLHQRLIDMYIPKEENQMEKCRIYTSIRNDSFGNNRTAVKCDSWVFSRKYYTKTIVTDVRFY